SLASRALQHGRAVSQSHNDSPLSAAAVLGQPGGTRFVAEIRGIEAHGVLAANWPFVLSVMAKSFLASAGTVERELRYQQVFNSAATLRRKLETSEAERKTSAEAAQKAGQALA